MTTQTISPAYNLQSVTFTQDSTYPYILNINAQTEFYNTRKIGSFNFFHKYGQLTMLDGSTKEYKQWNSLFNNFFKWDEMFGYTITDIKAAMTAGKEAIKQYNKEAHQEKVSAYTDKANNFLSKINNKDADTIQILQSHSDKSDEELMTLINNTFKGFISKKLANTILVAIKESFITIEEVTEVSNEESTPVSIDKKIKLQNKESFHLYKNTFSTYSEAYSHALKYKIPVTMIISSDHPSMTNERLQQLEYEYTFSKGNMSISDIKEYFTYISSLDTTLDQQERYYKLKSYIDRYNYSQQQKQTQKERQHNLMKEAATILYFMKKKGLSLLEKGDCGIVSTKYIYNNETIYHEVRGSGGITIEKYHQMITDIFNKHFSQYRDEYNELTLYWYTLPSKEYNHLMNIEGFMFTDMTKGEYGIICFDRLLSNNIIKLHNLYLCN